MLYPILPVPAPRMTRSDKWKQRKCVMAYRHFRDKVREAGIVLPVPYKVTFNLPMPSSWSEKKRKAMEGQPHTSKPDKDNLEKALLDALYENDSHVWSGWVEKRWARIPSIKIETLSVGDCHTE